MQQWERDYLRELAKKQLEYASLPIMKEREKLWYLHNDCKTSVPVVTVEKDTFLGDVMPEQKCESDLARKIEFTLLNKIVHHEMIDDDTVIPDFYSVSIPKSFKPFDLDIVEHRVSSDSIGYHLDHPVQDLEDDFHKLKKSTWKIDVEGALEEQKQTQDVIGDIMPVELRSGCFGFVPARAIFDSMGLENMMCAMYDYPDEFHQMMRMLTDDMLEYMKEVEKAGALTLCGGNDWLNQGSYGFTNDLPKDKERPNVKLSDIWGYMDSQETVDISPDMFDEFFFKYYVELTKQFGLLSYGCCEPVSAYWEKSLHKLENLRKISISAWCNEEYMGERLKGQKIVYLRKPSPNFFGVDEVFDEKGFEEHIKKTLNAAEGCCLEFAFRDVYTLKGDPYRAKKGVQLVRQYIEKYWRG